MRSLFTMSEMLTEFHFKVNTKGGHSRSDLHWGEGGGGGVWPLKAFN